MTKKIKTDEAANAAASSSQNSTTENGVDVKVTRASTNSETVDGEAETRISRAATSDPAEAANTDVNGAEVVPSAETSAKNDDNELLSKANKNATQEGQVAGDGPQEKKDSVTTDSPLVNALDPLEVAGKVAPGDGPVTEAIADQQKKAENATNIDQPYTGLVDANNPDSQWNQAPVEGSQKKTRKIRFLLSPTGRFGLGYNVGEVAKFDANQATELVDAAYAEYVDETEK